MLVFRLLKGNLNLRALAIVILAGKVNSKFCNGGHICSPPKECCPLGCCLVFASPGYRPTKSQISESSPMSSFLLWNHWFFWILFIFLLFIFFCGCGLWKKRQLLANRLCRRRSRNEEERSEFDSAGSCYPPPQYSRCSSFHYAPPPYTEVTSKPDLYPLVISYKPGNGKFGDNCVMVQYFKNYMVHSALGSLSSENAIDSINTSFFAQSRQEPDSNYPPTYDESRLGDNHLAGTIDATSSFRSQGQILGNNGTRVQDTDVPQIIVQQTVQKTVAHSKLDMNLPETFKNITALQNSAQSLSNTLHSEPSKALKVTRPSHLYLATFDQTNKPILSNSTDSINPNAYQAHRYTSEVILAQPQSYCESNSDLHYYSSDILNNSIHFPYSVNDSYSSEDNLSQARGSVQDFVSSDGLSHSQFSNLDVNNFSTSSEVSSLQGCGTPDSPPRAISPTGEFRNLLQKIQQLPSHKDSAKFFEPKFLKSLSNHCQSYNDEVLYSDQSMIKTSFGDSDDNDDINDERKDKDIYEFKTKKITAIRPHNFLKAFPSKSKTFYVPIGKDSLNSRKNNISKLSASAPVTPVTAFPSSNSLTLNFSSTSIKCEPKNSLRNNADSKPLLGVDDNVIDELF